MNSEPKPDLNEKPGNNNVEFGNSPFLFEGSKSSLINKFLDSEETECDYDMINIRHPKDDM